MGDSVVVRFMVKRGKRKDRKGGKGSGWGKVWRICSCKVQGEKREKERKES